MTKNSAYSILFVQKREVIYEQKALIDSFFVQNIPSARVSFASSPQDVRLNSRYDIVITPTVDFLDDLLDRLVGVTWIHFLSAGVEKIWNMQFDKSAYTLTKSSGVHASTMSEFAIGAMLYFEKYFYQFVEQSRNREWNRFWLGELTDRKVTILGVGSIGSEIAKKAKTFGMITVGAVHTYREVEYVDVMVNLSNIDKHLKDSDYVVSCLPLTQQTEGWLCEEKIGNFKKGAVLIDISRGGVTKESAVLSGLENGVLKGAALDVFEEQPLPKSSQLWANPNILLTPHVSGTTQKYLSNALAIFHRNFLCFKKEQDLPSQVNLKKGY